MIAAMNAPGLSVAAGPAVALDELQRVLARAGVEGRPLHTSHAFHSPMMDPVLEAFGSRFARVTLHEPRLPFVSNLTGAWIRSDEATDPAYWTQHLRQPVRFSEGLGAVLSVKPAVLLEVGPGQTLCALAARHLRGDASPVVLPTTRRAEAHGAADGVVLREALAGVWLAGVDVDWHRADDFRAARRVPLPVSLPARTPLDRAGGGASGGGPLR